MSALGAMLISACGQQMAPLGAELASKAERARSASISWAATALEADPDNITFQEIKSVLSERAIQAPSKQYASICDDSATIAFVQKELSSSNIYLCPQAESIDTAELAQILIHEASHIIGYEDDCDATANELQIVSLASRIPFRNAYVSACGLDQFSW